MVLGLRVYREALARSQFSIAVSSKILPGRISLLERGLTRPTAAERQRLEKVLGVPADRLFTDATTLLTVVGAKT